MEDFRLNKERGFNPRKRALLAEDSMATTRLLEKKIEKIGYDFESLSNGKDVFPRLIDAKKPLIDVILLDIGLPDISGIEVCKKIKSNDATKDIPVIFLTASNDENQIQRALDAGGSDFMLKFPHLAELHLRLKNAIKAVEQKRIIDEQENATREIFQNSQDILFVTSLDGIIIEISHSVQKILGYKREDILGKSVTESYFKKKSRGRFIKKLLKNQRLDGYLVDLKKSDNHTIKASINATLKKDQSGNPEKIIGSIREIVEKILPICMYCKSIRVDDSWQSLEQYLTENIADLSHGLCPDCFKKEHPEYYEDALAKGKIK